jgi:RNA polymerase sigma-70 factor, ECF subfamily
VQESLTSRKPTTPPPAAPQAAGSEAGLLERLRAGDEAACEILVRDHTARLLAVARRYMRNEEDARDAVQEAFIAAFRAIGRFEGGSSLSTWLHRIAINACLMKLRSARRRPEASIEELLPTFDETGHRLLGDEGWPESVETALGRSQTRDQVRAAIGRLPEKYRTVILLRDIEELSTEEAARILGATPTAVKIRLHRARQALRGLIARDFAAPAARA